MREPFDLIPRLAWQTSYPSPPPWRELGGPAEHSPRDGRRGRHRRPPAQIRRPLLRPVRPTELHPSPDRPTGPDRDSRSAFARYPRSRILTVRLESSISSPLDMPHEKSSPSEVAVTAFGREAGLPPTGASSTSQSQAIRDGCRACPRPGRESACRIPIRVRSPALREIRVHSLQSVRDPPRRLANPSRSATRKRPDRVLGRSRH